MTDAPVLGPFANDDRRVAEQLNHDCFCIDVEAGRVWSAVAATNCHGAALQVLKDDRPHLFSTSPVFLARSEVDAMLATVRAIEAVTALPAFQADALARAPAVAGPDFGPKGVLMGYDFHLTPEGPRLIEVNTNAGGAFLNAQLVQAQVARCELIANWAWPGPILPDFEAQAWTMFLAEWLSQGRAGVPKVVAIVDEAPEAQYLYPEFRLVQALFARHGVTALIVDPSELAYAEGRLHARGLVVDLVYNRLVDFAFDRPVTTALRAAYLAGAAVVTPNPRNHALVADKRNLVPLSDPATLKAMGANAVDRAVLATLPRAVAVTPDTAEALWAGRRQWVFKPAGGHAGKAVYRGDKLTKGAWGTILEGGFIAQAFAAPSERRVQVVGVPQVQKMDVRLYTYAGDLLLAAARLYRGQTTNFRTPGGGFAPVIVLGAA